MNSNLGLSRTVTEIQQLIGQKSQLLPTPLSFSALVQDDPLRIYGKAFLFLKLESSRHRTVKIWWSQLGPFLPDPPVWRTDGRTDRRTDGQNCDG